MFYNQHLIEPSVQDHEDDVGSRFLRIDFPSVNLVQIQVTGPDAA